MAQVAVGGVAVSQTHFDQQTFRLELASHSGGGIAIKDECTCPCLPPCMWCTCGELYLGSANEAAEYTYDADKGRLGRGETFKHYLLVDWSKHEEGGKVTSFSCGLFPVSEDQAFDIMSDGTLADRKRPELVVGIRESDKQIVLVHRNDPNRCIFKAFLGSPGQVSMTETVGKRDVEETAFQINDAVTWTDSMSAFVAMVMEDNDVPRGTVGTVIASEGDSVTVRFPNTEIELKPSDLIKVQPTGQSASSAVQPATATPPQQVKTVTVQVPYNALPGATIQAQAPTGETLRIQVPEGTAPGSQLTVQY